MKKKYSKFLLLFYPVLFLLSLVSCNEEEEKLTPSRLFMPAGQIASSSGETSVKLTWKTPPNTVPGSVTYTVEVAADTLFATPVIYSAVADTAAITLTDDNIPIKQKLFARIKTNAKGDTPESKWLTSNGFSIRGIQLFTDVPVKSEDITDRSVRLRFIARPNTTRVVVTPTGGTAREITLSPSDLTSGFLIVDGLTSGANYRAEIFAGTKSNGVTTFQTKEPLSGNIVDLRGITGRPSVLQDTITQIPNGSTIILKRGQTYNISAETLLNKSVTITSGTDLTEPNLASVYFTSNFAIAEGSNIDYIIFRDVVLTGSDATAKYVFNINKTSTIGTMTFENVRAGKFRGIVRLQSAPTVITNFTMNNSIVDSLGSYGVINVDVATSQAQNIVIKNTTIYKAEKIVVSRNNSTSVLFENVTVNESPLANNYLVDYSTTGSNNVSQGVKINNTILGIGKAGNQSVRGVRVGTSTAVEANNSYTTSDYVLAATGAFPIPGIKAYSGTSLALWQDPKNGNFKIKDANFPGMPTNVTAGDPRWR
ncbi:DUF5123 domain-containing protein [Rufibacter ruber]|uniref:DUF5123 domain-containing protein n=1 Tax=Rufibacter ruber TaxID=1783499 RepID=UPI00082F4BB1|nr:DUF5123 domain-containing protein [Rufibacter ruber]